MAARALSSCGEQGLLSSRAAQASHCGGFSRGGLPGGSVVMNLPARLQTWVRSLGEEEITTHSSFIAWEIPWTEELVGFQVLASMGSVVAAPRL